jgi:hypothetical protein
MALAFTVSIHSVWRRWTLKLFDVEPTDTLMHCLMVLITATVLAGCYHALGVYPTIAIATAWATLLREVTQRQSRYFHDDFRKGWDAWRWSRGKLLETIVPMALILTIGFLA